MPLSSSSKILGLKPRRFTAALLAQSSTFTKIVLLIVPSILTLRKNIKEEGQNLLSQRLNLKTDKFI
jgi:hypothetical protein